MSEIINLIEDSVTDILNKVENNIQTKEYSVIEVTILFHKIRKLLNLFNKSYGDIVKIGEQSITDELKDKNSFEKFKVKVEKGITHKYIKYEETKDQEYLELLKLRHLIEKRIANKELDFKKMATEIYDKSIENPFKIIPTNVQVLVNVPEITNKTINQKISIPTFRNKFGIKYS